MRPRWFTSWKLALAAVVSGAVLIEDAFAQSYPEKPIRIVMGFPPGGAVDFVGRLVGQKLTESLGQPIVIENRPGAATSIAAERVAKAPPDGYTLLLIPISTAVQAGARNNLPYNLKRDIAPVSQIASGPLLLLVHPSLPARGLKDLIALAGTQPGKLEWSSPGISGVPGFEYSTWYGLAAPTGTPKDVVGRLNSEVVRIGKATDVRSALDKQGLVPAAGSPEQFAALIDRTIEQTIALSKTVGLKLD